MDYLPTRIKIFSKMMLVTLLWISCGPGHHNSSTVTSIYQESEFTLVQRDSPAADWQRVGSLQSVLVSPESERFAIPYCTAIRVSRRHLLTANHCVKADAIFNDAYLASLPTDGDLKVMLYEHVVRLSFRGSIDQKSSEREVHAPLLSQPLYQDAELDFAILKIPDDQNGSSGEDMAVVELAAAVAIDDLSKDKDIQLFGYPNGVPLTRARCHFVQKVEAVPWLAHDCDALNGASGGLIVDGNQGLAMHQAGPAANDGYYYKEKGVFETPEEFAKRRGCPEIDGQLERSCVLNKGYNRALPLVVIRQELTNKAPNLWAEMQER